jgi:hypothetical protein
MSCDDTKSLIDSYIEWFKERISFEQLEGSCEITTPFLDRHNDAIVIYLERNGDEILLTDDGYTLSDLSLSGVDMTPNRQQILKTMLNGFGVENVENELVVITSQDDFPRKKHNLVQTILAVNDMFMTGQAMVRSLFLEEVEAFLKENEVHFSKAITLKGKSQMDHTFDFHIAPTQNQPERLIQAVGRPERQTVITKILYPLMDVRERRPTSVVLYAFLNDKERVSSDLISHVKNGGATPVLWSGREKIVSELATA